MLALVRRVVVRGLKNYLEIIGKSIIDVSFS
jgi:hypothetical protein